MVREPLQTAGLATLAESPVLRLHASHVYANAALVAEVLRLLPAGLRSEGLLALLPARLSRPLAADAGPSGLARLGNLAVAGARTAAIVARLVARERAWSPWQRAKRFERECAEVRRTMAELEPPDAATSAPALYAEMRAVEARLGDYLAVVSWGVVYAYVFYHLATELARRWAPELVAERAALTINVPGVASLDVARELAELGMRLGRHPDLLARIRRAGADAGWEHIVRDHGPIGGAFRSFLARHGHRIAGRDLLCPTWREAPAIVVGLAAQAARAAAADTHRADDRAGDADRHRSATLTIERAIARGVAGPLRRAAFRSVLGAARRYHAVRENMRYHADFFLARLRELTIALGARLVATGRLATPLDLCFLTVDEIGQTLGTDESLGARAADRRRGYERDALVVPPLELTTAGGTPATHDGRGTRTLHGETGAPGRCRARARLVHGPTDFERVERGEVVVAVYVDPGWTPVLELAGGLVLEASGLLSHGAIVARELGIPALVGVAAVTRTIRDGDVLDLDADAGVVAIVTPA